MYIYTYMTTHPGDTAIYNDIIITAGGGAVLFSKPHMEEKEGKPIDATLSPAVGKT